MSADEQRPDVALSVSAESVTPTAVLVRPVGDVDTATAGRLREAVETEVGRGALHVVLDLAGVAFLGSAGLALLVDQRAAAAARDGSLRLAAVPRAAARPLALTGLAELFDTHDDVEGALADLR